MQTKKNRREFLKISRRGSGRQPGAGPQCACRRQRRAADRPDRLRRTRRRSGGQCPGGRCQHAPGGHGRRLQRPPAKHAGQPQTASSTIASPSMPNTVSSASTPTRSSSIAALTWCFWPPRPHFRPIHLKACVDAGKHVFCEKPVAVDGPGVRSVLATCEEAAAKKLNVVSGLCWRYDYGVRETMKRVLDGAIGDIVAIRETYNTGTLWQRPRQPNWTEMEYQMRNWYYFTWLSGDHNCEQHVHSLDKAAWAMHDEPPRAGLGPGRPPGPHGRNLRRHLRPSCRLLRICQRRSGLLLLPPDGRLQQRRERPFPGHPRTRRHPGQQDLRCQGQGRMALPGAQAQHVRRGAPGAVCGDPLRKGHQQRRRTWPAAPCWRSWAAWRRTPGRRSPGTRRSHSGLKLAPEKYAMDATPPIVPDKDGKYPVPVPGATKTV